MLTPPTPRLRRAPLVLAAAALFAACDSGNAVDPPSPADVAGVYTVAAFRFQPTAQALAPADVLADLDPDVTSVEILDSGDVVFRYRLDGGLTRVLLGEVEVRSAQVRLTFTGQTDAGRLAALLPSSLTLDRVEGVLVASTTFRANLAAYDDEQYAGFTDVPGTLTIRLAPQADA
jgi:hypothetical protein